MNTKKESPKRALLAIVYPHTLVQVFVRASSYERPRRVQRVQRQSGDDEDKAHRPLKICAHVNPPCLNSTTPGGNLHRAHANNLLLSPAMKPPAALGVKKSARCGVSELKIVYNIHVEEKGRRTG